MDPIADQFAYLSVYNYASNDPVKNIDLHGLQGVTTSTGATLARPSGVATRLSPKLRPPAQGTTIGNPRNPSALDPIPVPVSNELSNLSDNETFLSQEGTAATDVGEPFSAEQMEQIKSDVESRYGDDGGYAVLHRDFPTEDNRIGHYSIEIFSNEGGKLHTHQVTNNDQTKSYIDVRTDKGNATESIPLPNAKGALLYQKQMLSAGNLGRYDLKNNSCLSHVCDVLKAGGVNVPEGAIARYQKAKKIFKE